MLSLISNPLLKTKFFGGVYSLGRKDNSASGRPNLSLVWY